MEKSLKAGIVVGVIFAIVSLGLIGHSLTPFDITEEVWLPERYSWANNRLPVKEVFLSGIAVTISLDEYKQRFSEAENTLILSSDINVDIYYLTKQEGITYCAKECYGCWYSGLTRLEGVEMISGAEIYLNYQTCSMLVFAFTLGAVLLSVVGGVLTYAYFSKSPKGH